MMIVNHHHSCNGEFYFHIPLYLCQLNAMRLILKWFDRGKQSLQPSHDDGMISCSVTFSTFTSIRINFDLYS